MDKKKIEKAISLILEAIGENVKREELIKTPKRVAEMYEELLSGYNKDARKELKILKGIKYDEIILLKDMPLYSICEHHLLPFIGKIHIAYIPNNGRITGLSKLARCVDVLAKRLQVQERLTQQIADTIEEVLHPKGIFVIIEAEHLCMTMRGVKKENSIVTTSAVKGTFRKDIRARQEALNLIKR